MYIIADIALLLVVSAGVLAHQPVQRDVPADPLISMFKKQEVLLKTMEQTLQMVNSRLNTADNNIKLVNSKLDAADNNFKTVNTKLVAAENSIKLVDAKIDTKTDALSSKIDDARQKLDRLNVLSPCPSQFAKNGYGCYKFSTSGKTWSGAVRDCASTYGGHLAVTETSGELEALKLLVKEAGVSRPYYWVGGMRKSEREFVWKGTDDTIGFNWHSDYPASFGANDGRDCLHLYDKLGSSNYGTWYPGFCSYPHYYICEI